MHLLHHFKINLSLTHNIQTTGQFISKIIEKAALSQLMKQFYKIDSFINSNSGYKSHSNIETILTKITFDILHNMDNEHSQKL